MNKIGFFGGCFNPPTNIHMNIAKKLIKTKQLDKVIFVPVNDFYKKNDLAKANHRYNMLKLITNNNEKLDVDDIEIKESKQLFAVDIFKIIYNNNKYTSADKYFIMGSDNYYNMPNWKEYENIKDKYKYIIIERNENEISATQIRKMIKNKNAEVSKYLPKEIYEYIINNKLYIT